MPFLLLLILILRRSETIPYVTWATFFHQIFWPKTHQFFIQTPQVQFFHQPKIPHLSLPTEHPAIQLINHTIPREKKKKQQPIDRNLAQEL